MINLEKKYLEIVQSILKKHIPNETVWLFGSRVTSNIKRYSDIDLVILSQTSIPSAVMSKLILSFAESDLPYKVDVLDWSMLDQEFRTIIKEQYEVLQIP